MAKYQSSLTGPEIDAALTDMAQHDSEAWAVGQRDGSAVTSLDITYENNAKYYSDNAMGAAARAEAAVPAGTAGAVFFDQAQTLTDAQKAQARTNIGAGTINSSNVIQTPAVVNVASIAALKTQMSTWYTAQGANSVGFYNVAFTAAASPFSAGARVNIQINAAANANNGVAILTYYGASSPEMYLMRLYNGTWGGPKKVTSAT